MLASWFTRKNVGLSLAGGVLLFSGLVYWNLHRVRRLAVITFDVGYALSAQTLRASYPDAATQTVIPIHLTPILTGLEEPTDLQPIPGTKHEAVVLQKGGEALWVDLTTGTRRPFFSVDVITESEQGLLGIAFPADFETSKRFFLDYTVREDKDYTIIQEFQASGTPPSITATPGRILLRVEQPYQNHNAGQIGVGPDGHLYVSMGDGGFANDPHGHGQNPKTLLGSILRLDTRPNHPVIPMDNPILPGKQAPTEIWAYGLRNPWRFSWDDSERLIVADVGQDLWEEIHVVEKGDNLGWNRMEGNHCFPPDPKELCDTNGLVRPIFEYDHDQGNSITGGFVSQDNRLPTLKGKYVFGDFVRGQIWALELPKDRKTAISSAISLGKWPLLISSFGRDGSGRMYVLDYAQGRILRIDPIP